MPHSPIVIPYVSAECAAECKPVSSSTGTFPLHIDPTVALYRHAKSTPYTFSPSTTTIVTTSVHSVISVCVTTAQTLYCVGSNLCALLLPEYESTARAWMRHIIHRHLMIARCMHSTLGKALYETVVGHTKPMGDHLQSLESGVCETWRSWYREEVEGVLSEEETAASVPYGPPHAETGVHPP